LDAPLRANKLSNWNLWQQVRIKQIKGWWLFQRDPPLTNAREIIGWWEARRIPYNLIVGCAGMLTCLALLVIAAASFELFHSDFGLPDPPGFAIFGVILYGIGANVCYTGGWITELILCRVFPGEYNRWAALSFFLGLLFSVLLTLLPAILISAVGFFRLLARLSAVH
jgi:hypothetical protein